MFPIACQGDVPLDALGPPYVTQGASKMLVSMTGRVCVKGGLVYCVDAWDGGGICPRTPVSESRSHLP